jgi:RHS repeat-associated protein
MEKNSEMGNGLDYDLGARMYNSKLGRMFSSDPRESEYPWQSTYAYYSNSPVSIIDFMGKGGEGDDETETETETETEDTWSSYLSELLDDAEEGLGEAVDKVSEKVSAVVDYVDNLSVTAKSEVKVSIGAQAGIKTPIVDVFGNGGALTLFNLTKGTTVLGDGSNEPVKTDMNYLNKDGWTGDAGTTEFTQGFDFSILGCGYGFEQSSDRTVKNSQVSFSNKKTKQGASYGDFKITQHYDSEGTRVGETYSYEISGKAALIFGFEGANSISITNMNL